MRRTYQPGSWRLMAASAVMLVAGAGCGMAMPAWTPTQTSGTARAPRVEDCAIVAISSPTRYACNGKVYTSFQLAKMRMDDEKKYASGK